MQSTSVLGNDLLSTSASGAALSSTSASGTSVPSTSVSGIDLPGTSVSLNVKYLLLTYVPLTSKYVYERHSFISDFVICNFHVNL